MLNLQALEQAFSGISDVGKGTIECDFDGRTIVLASLLPHEEVAVQKYAAVALEENKDALSANTEFLDRFQIGLLSYAVCRIDDIDLSGETHVETGEVLANGVRVKIPRNEAVRKIVASWSRIVRQFLFRKYSELMDRVDLESEKLVKYDPLDLSAEIERLEARIAELKERKADKDNEQEAKHPFRQQLDTFATRKVEDAPQTAPEQPQAAPEPVAAPVPPVAVQTPVADQPAPSVPQPRRPISPSAPPPPTRVQPQTAPEPSATSVLDGIEQAQQDQDSFMLEDLEAQVAAENERLARVRAARQTAPAPQQQLRRPPPHMQVQMPEPDEVEHTQVHNVGQVSGVEAFRIGDVPTLSDKAPQQRTAQGVAVNQNVNNGTTNPRFRRG